ncbi:MAG: carotenoid 1,2-hydratase [Verrucomicrobia bacterium]|nr:carotenoid 1,2-hydratase [Verrucomicrobiota bacterium]
MKKLLPIFLLSLAASFLQSAEPWTRALTPWSWSFPRDHGAHPEFKTEWWYLTGNLDDEKGNPYGYELTFFRHGLQPKPTQPDSAWSIRDIYFAHLAITDVQSRRFIFSEKLSRGALGEVEISQQDMQVRIADSSLPRKSDSSFQMAASDPTAGSGLKLSATPLKPLTYQGEKGLSRKSATPGNASHYYSFTRLQTTGQLELGGKKIPVKGLSWFDHEFSTSALGEDQEGWDWFCLQFDSGEELMLYRMRNPGERTDPSSSGTWIPARGPSVPLKSADFTITPIDEWKTASGAIYPSGWNISVPSLQLSGEVQPLLFDQELRLKRTSNIRYWEGACRFTGTRNGKAISGRGYTELTGYASPIGQGMKE